MSFSIVSSIRHLKFVSLVNGRSTTYKCEMYKLSMPGSGYAIGLKKRSHFLIQIVFCRGLLLKLFYYRAL